MAKKADDRHVRDQLKVLTGLKLPGFNWKANMTLEFDIFYQTLAFVLEGMEIPKDKWYLYILQQLGRCRAIKQGMVLRLHVSLF